MPLTLLYGPAIYAYADELLSACAAAAASRDALLVVPTAADTDHFERELAAGGVLFGRALTFSGLIGEIARRAGLEAAPLRPVARERLLRSTLSSLELPALGEAARAPGVATAAGRLLAELGSSRVPAPRFAAALRAWAQADPDRVSYAQDLAAIALRYARELDRGGRRDAEAFAWAALDALRNAPDRWGATPVFVYGFDDLTAIERDTIETLARVAQAAVTVALTYEPGRGVLAARAATVEALRGQAAVVRELPASDAHYAPAARVALGHLERHLFVAPPARVDPGDTVVLLEAGGERAEAELIAAAVLAAQRDGVPAEEIAVVCRSLSRSGALLEHALERFGIAAASHRRVPLGHTPLGRGLLALGRCALLPRGQASAADLLAYLRSPGAAGGLDAVDELEAVVRRTGRRTAQAARAAASFEIPEIDELRAASDPAAATAAQVRRLLAASRRASAALLGPDEALDARAAAVVLAALDELGPFTSEEGGELLALLGGLEIPVCAERAAGVLITEPLAIRARRFRWVLICGLCEGEFPAPTAGDPFLSDERRHELALASGLALPDAGDPLARERYLFHACATRATERLVLSYRSSDEEGNRVLASPFIADVAELFVPAWRERRRRRLLADVVWPLAEAPTPRERALSLAAGAARRLAPAGGPPLRTLSERALAHVRHRKVVSGGALESFARCPVAWLVERQLQPGELDPESEPLVKGEFMHEVLERVIAELGGPFTPSSLEQAERLLDELTATPPASLAPGAPHAVRVAILRGIEADLRRYVRQEAYDGCDWQPVAVELEFGLGDDEAADALPAVELGEGEDRVLLRGVIDRIDVDPETGRRAIVRDYKSGAVRPERAGRRWRDGREFQVALYMIAVRRLLGLEPVAGYYQSLTGQELRPRGAFSVNVGRRAYLNDMFAADKLDVLLAEIEQEAVQVAATLRRGELLPTPETCSRDGCRHPGICWALR